MATTVKISAPSLNDPGATDEDSAVIEDNYVLITDGTAHRHHVQVHWRKDGTCTHVITVKGIRSGSPLALAPEVAAETTERASPS